MDVHYRDKHRLYLPWTATIVANNALSLQGNLARSEANQSARTIEAINNI